MDTMYAFHTSVIYIAIVYNFKRHLTGPIKRRAI